MDAILNSFVLVAISEFGDKTQLLALVLALRFSQPWSIMAGILFATLLNHGLASWFGSWLAQLVSTEILRYFLAGSFLAFGLWILIPDKEEEEKSSHRFGAFWTTLITFFLAEIGDKTQLATIALGAAYQNTIAVLAGTTLGMLFSDGLAVASGERLIKKVPMKYVRIFASITFIAFGCSIFWKII